MNEIPKLDTISAYPKNYKGIIKWETVVTLTSLKARDAKLAELIETHCTSYLGHDIEFKDILRVLRGNDYV